jgi:hypothetical protein
MATIIEFFVPVSFSKKATKPEEYGKMIPFRLPQKKSAWRLLAFENRAFYPTRPTTFSTALTSSPFPAPDALK